MSKNSSRGSTAAGAAGSRGFGAAALREGATTPSCAAQPLWSSSAAQASILAQRGCRLGDGCPTAAPAHDARGLLLWLAPCGALGAPLPRAHAVECLQSGCGRHDRDLFAAPPLACWFEELARLRPSSGAPSCGAGSSCAAGARNWGLRCGPSLPRPTPSHSSHFRRPNRPIGYPPTIY